MTERLDKLKRMLAARERLPQGNWGENCAAIRAEIARLETPAPKRKSKA
jgi:hypothetical protein